MLLDDCTYNLRGMANPLAQGFRASGLGFRALGLGFRASGLGFRAWGLG